MPESNTYVEFEQLCGCGLAVCAATPVLRNVPISTEEAVDTAVGSLGWAMTAETLSFLASPRRANYHKGWPDLPVLPVFAVATVKQMWAGTDSLVVELLR